MNYSSLDEAWNSNLIINTEEESNHRDNIYYEPSCRFSSKEKLNKQLNVALDCEPNQ